MATYNCFYRTNYFRVTDEAKCRYLFSKLSGADLEIFDDDGGHPGLHGFGGSGSLLYCDASTVAEWMSDSTHDKPVKLYEEADRGSGVWTLLPNPDQAKAEELYIATVTEKDDEYEIHVRYTKEELVSDDGMDSFYEELQKILPDDEAMILVESGHEKLRYVTGFATIVTNKEIRFLNVSDIAVKTAGEMLGKKFETQMDY